MLTPTPPENRELKYNLNPPVIGPSADSEKRLIVRERELQRIQRKVKAIPKQTPWFAIIASFLLSVAVTAGFSIIPLRQSTGLGDWVVPFYVCVTAAGLILGLICIGVDRYIRRIQEDESTGVEDDIGEMLSCFEEVQKSPHRRIVIK